MIPSKPNRNESRRSSILKPCKPRQPLQNVNLNPSCIENSPSTSKVKRRVSFAEKKHVKEFCHSTEQGTVWDNTYEEHDFSLKGSVGIDKSRETESKENMLKCTSKDSCVYVAVETLNYSNDCNVRSSQPTRVFENDNNKDCDLKITDPVEYIELTNEGSLVEESMLLNVPKNISGNIVVYRDEKNCEGDVDDNVASELDKTSIQDMSMEFTGIISTSSSSHVDTKENKPKDMQEYHALCQNNFYMDCTANCNNMTMEISQQIVPISVEPNLGMSEQVSVIQYCENGDGTNSTHNNTAMMSVNSQLRETLPQNIIDKQTQNRNTGDDSIELTTIVPSFVTNSDVYSTNNNENDIISNSSMEMTAVLPETHQGNITSSCDANTVAENCLKEAQGTFENTDKIEFFSNVPTEITCPINIALLANAYKQKDLRADEPELKHDRTTFFHDVSMEMTKAVSLKDGQEITNASAGKLLLKENKDGKEDITKSICFNDRTKLFHKLELMKSTEASLSQMSRTHLPEENFVGSVSQTDVAMNDNRIHDISMEMTATVSTGDRQEIVNPNICKPLSVGNTKKKKDINQFVSSNEKTELLHKSMDFTEAVSSCRDALNMHTIQSMQMFSQITPGQQSSSKNPTESLMQTDAIMNGDKTIRNISMEMTDAVSSGNRQEIVDTNIHKSLPVGNTEKEININQYISSNERTELFHKSMDFTEAVPSYRASVFSSMHTTQSTDRLFSQTTLRQQSPSKNSTESLIEIDATMNDDKTTPNLSMEMTDAVSSNLRLTRNTADEMEKLIVSKSDESQRFTTIDTRESEHLTESGKNVRIENIQFAKEIVETTNIHNELLNNHVLTDNLDFSVNATLKNVTNRKRISCENENTYLKRVRNSFESQCYKENDAHSSHKLDDNYTNGNTCDERLDTADSSHTLIQTLEKDGPDEINECSFLRESLPYLENNFLELQSIDPPSLICMDSEEENSFLDTRRKNEYETLMISDATSTNNKNSSSDRLETINIKYDQAKVDHKDIITNKIGNDDWETKCQAMVGSTNSNNQINKSNRMDTEVLDEENISISNTNYGGTVTVPSTDCFTGTELIEKDQIDEKKNTREKINDDAMLPNIQKQGRHSNAQEELETEKRQIVECADHLEESKAIIENQKDREEHHGENLNVETNVQNMIQEKECANVQDRLEPKQYVSAIEDEPVVEQDPFLSLSQKLEAYAESDDCIWNVHHKNIDRKIIVFGFISSSLLIVIFLSDNFNALEENVIKQIKIISRLSDDADALIKIVHGLIMEKIDVNVLMHLYKTHEDLLPMLDFISQEVKLAMDFMFELKRLNDPNLMEIACDNFSFVSRSKQMDIILKITINVKRFDKLTPNDISVQCLLGTVKTIEVKNLIKAVRKDHRFLRRYMKDVRDYIDIMEEISTQSNK